MNPTITKYVDVYFADDGEPWDSDCYETLNDAISNLWQHYDHWECWDDEKKPLAAISRFLEANIIDQGHWGTFVLKHCLEARGTKIYFRKMEDLKHFEGTLYTDEEREIIDGTL